MNLIETDSITLLVIDTDNNSTSTFLADLNEKGYRVLLAQDEEDLPIILLGQHVDLVLFDVNRAESGDPHIYNRLRAIPEIGKSPIIVVTEKTEDVDCSTMLAHGANDFLLKPFTLNELCARIRLHLRLAHLEKNVAENARNLTAEQTQRKQIERLYQMAKFIGSSLEVNEVLVNAAHSLEEIFEVEGSALFLADSNQERLFFLDVQQGSGRTLNRIPLTAENSIVSHVVKEGRSILLNNVPAEPRFFTELNNLCKLNIRSFLCVPLAARQKNIGAVALFNKQGCEFNKTDLSLLRSVASSIAIALENAKLHRKQAELVQEIASSHEQLWRNAKLAATGRLAASWAHEINNPLQAVHSCLQLAIHFDLELEKQAEYIGMACEEVERMIDIVTRILDFARPSPGNLEMTNINRVISQVIRLSSKHMAHNRWELQQNLASDIPEVQVIRDQINQLFLNIVLNAFDSMPDGGKLHVTTSYQKDWVLIRLRDTGTGMSADVQSRIFEPFFTTKQGASGLGLSLSYGIVTRHGGHIEVESKEGVGTTFTVFLPILHKEAIKPTMGKVL